MVSQEQIVIRASAVKSLWLVGIFLCFGYYVAACIADIVRHGVSLAPVALGLICAACCGAVLFKMFGEQLIITDRLVFVRTVAPLHYFPRHEVISFGDIAAVTIATRVYFDTHEQQFNNDILKRLLWSFHHTYDSRAPASGRMLHTEAWPILYVAARPAHGGDFAAPLTSFSKDGIKRFAAALEQRGAKVFLDPDIFKPRSDWQ